MKKVTLSFFLIIFIASFNITIAQNLQAENFDSLTVGNVGTDITGSTSGQGGLFTQTTVGANSDFQITNEGGQLGKVLQITGSNNATDSKLLWTSGLDTAWASRTTGNDIIEIEYNIFTGAATTSKSLISTQLYNSDYSITIAGFLFVPETKLLLGLIYADDGNTIDTFPINLGSQGTEIILLPNSWYRIGLAFDKTTGDITFKGPGFYLGFTDSEATGIDPFENDFIVIAGTDNTVSTVAKFDDLRIRATNTENLLGINDIDNNLSKSIKLYPNPARNVINLSAKNNLNLTKLEIVDIHGRLIKSIPIKNISEKEINISEFNKGIYLMNIYSKNGMTSKKIIKE
ncbi:hypothetical protein A8C32_16215 [Flavivirga aquatica]|uniref:Secretion system C-terminal sorting domain-containing protein n=1 Tax=Flavivirga aquatica TaxID=1849968 RepID=A0A1E5T9E8_9FLAO|nr:T9SS type A sorting domain-containing protein [Flavivirga aquatica]OEK08002.1 hypothetical protein A8C32_16215 [Flavivirga aquatica]